MKKGKLFNPPESVLLSDLWEMSLSEKWCGSHPKKEVFFFSLAPFSPCSYFYLRSIYFFQKYTETKTYFQTDVLQVGSSILLSLQAITSERPRQMGSLWKHHHWPRQLSLRASHTVNTITRPSEWRQPLDRHMLSSERWQHRHAQTSMKALVWAFWSTAINFQYFKYVFECFRISVWRVQRTNVRPTMLRGITDASPWQTLVLIFTLSACL